MEDLQLAILEAYDFVQMPFRIVRYDVAKQQVDGLYGEVPEKVPDYYDCRGIVVEKPKDAVLQRFGITQQVDLMLSIAQQTIANLGFDPEETDKVEYKGRLFRIAKVQKEVELPVAETETDTENIAIDYLVMAIFAVKDG